MFWNPSTKEMVKMVPISSQRDFEQHWEPVSLSLGLKWIPAFIRDVTIPPQYLSTVISELKQIKSTLIISPPLNMPVTTAKDIVSRIDMLIHALESPPTDPKIEISIG